MNVPKRLVASLLMLAASALAGAQDHHPYAGQHERSVKALSDDEIKQYLAGAGMGYAKAAELNGYPGPMHVLELADKLALSAEQRDAITEALQIMRQRLNFFAALRLSRKIIGVRAVSERHQAGVNHRTGGHAGG